MRKRTTYLVAALVGLVILALGVAFAATRTTDYKSSATLLLAPKKSADPDTLSSLLDSYGRSGAAGTYVQLISARDTLRRTGVSGVTVEVTPVPDARTIEVETTGPQQVVQPALAAVIRAAQDREPELGDVWRIEVLASPSAPQPAGLTTVQAVGASVLLALLGALFVLVVLLRYRFLGSTALGEVDGLDLSRPGFSAPELEQTADVRVSFDLESFRFVKASPTTVLLQVTGYWRSEHPTTLGAPTLVLHDEERAHPISPLATPDSRAPEAGPETPLWRGSFAAPLEILDRHDRIALRAGPGLVVALPAPTEQSLLSAVGHTNGVPERDAADAPETVEDDEPIAGDAEPVDDTDDEGEVADAEELETVADDRRSG